MDNLTHSLAGALLGQIGLKRLSGRAMPTLIIAANLPDIDAMATLLGPTSLAFRRGITHGPIALALHLARHLSKPILVEGPAGVGQTELSRAIAAWLGLPLHRLVSRVMGVASSRMPRPAARPATTQLPSTG